MLTTLLDADKQEFYEFCEQEYKEQLFAQKHPRLYAWRERLTHVKYFFLYTYCRLTDHLYDDGGWANTESGCISMHCKRCGVSWPTHWLY